MLGYRSPWMTLDLDALRARARGFIAREIQPHTARFAAQRCVDRDVWHRAGELGLLCLSIPEQYGGRGGTFAHEAVMIEEQARIGDSSWGAPLHSAIVAHYLLTFGREDQKQQWLPKMASGEVVGAIATTEPGACSDHQKVKTTATRVGNEYVIRGSKKSMFNGSQADLALVLARTVGATKRANGTSLILVEGDHAGLHRSHIHGGMGEKSYDAAEFTFEDVRVPTTNLLGETEGRGFGQLMENLAQEWLVVLVGSLAGMEAALEHTLRHTKDRCAFGKPIFSFQNTRLTLAEAATETRIARIFIDDCITKHIRGRLDIQTVAMAKWWTTERAMKVLDECLQLHGGYGYISEYPITRVWADNRVQKLTSETMKHIIARAL